MLRGNFPNPFNPRTSIRFDLPAADAVRLRVYDAAGRMVRQLLDRRFDAGSHQADWDGRGTRGQVMASGVYFYRLEAAGASASRSMVLAR